MKKDDLFLIKKYAKMSGDKKVRIALSLSKMARIVRQAGSVASGGSSIWNPIRQNFLK